MAINVYRIIQEAFTNIIKHAKCQSVEFRMVAAADRLQVQIRDDGTGFCSEDVSKREIEQRGMGLFIIQERAKAINGKFRISSEPGQGTEIQLEVPVRTS